MDAMDAACQDILAEHCQGWIRHTKRFFPRCLAREDIRCDVDENMWPNAEVLMWVFYCLYIHIINDSYIAFFSCILFFFSNVLLQIHPPPP